MLDLSVIDKSIFVTEIEKFCFAIVNIISDNLNEGSGFHIIDENGPAELSNVVWEGKEPFLTDEEIRAKIIELFPEI